MSGRRRSWWRFVRDAAAVAVALAAIAKSFEPELRCFFRVSNCENVRPRALRIRNGCPVPILVALRFFGADRVPREAAFAVAPFADNVLPDWTGEPLELAGASYAYALEELPAGYAAPQRGARPAPIPFRPGRYARADIFDTPFAFLKADTVIFVNC